MSCILSVDSISLTTRAGLKSVAMSVVMRETMMPGGGRGRGWVDAGGCGMEQDGRGVAVAAAKARAAFWHTAAGDEHGVAHGYPDMVGTQ